MGPYYYYLKKWIRRANSMEKRKKALEGKLLETLADAQLNQSFNEDLHEQLEQYIREFNEIPNIALPQKELEYCQSKLKQKSQS